jgi:hypothetical protein
LALHPGFKPPRRGEHLTLIGNLKAWIIWCSTSSAYPFASPSILWWNLNPSSISIVYESNKETFYRIYLGKIFKTKKIF